ncbi:thioesterase II family protein [Longitalea arenae]|uniref:thioesterase II family protein n=1 Tax=Longitalea arenae TaxID=2812558 RepID=UPI001966E39F|nr:thioesterase [Longitalea arenae]
MKEVKLFCFPYAGGSAVLYNSWKNLLDPAILLRPIELAGRGSRIAEPFYANIPEMITDVYNQIRPEIQNGPYAFFGHSMGAMIAYKLAHLLRRLGSPEPACVMFSGRSAPHIMRDERKNYALMEDEVFQKEVLELGGTPAELFMYPELVNYYMPLLRNDFMLAEETPMTEDIEPFNFNITILFGAEEDLNWEQRTGWQAHTNKKCNIHVLNGGHFFIHTAMKEVTTIINDTIRDERCGAMANRYVR